MFCFAHSLLPSCPETLAQRPPQRPFTLTWWLLSAGDDTIIVSSLGDGTKLIKFRFRLNIRKRFFTERSDHSSGSWYELATIFRIFLLKMTHCQGFLQAARNSVCSCNGHDLWGLNSLKSRGLAEIPCQIRGQLSNQIMSQQTPGMMGQHLHINTWRDTIYSEKMPPKKHHLELERKNQGGSDPKLRKLDWLKSTVWIGTI